MRKLTVTFLALFLIITFISAAYADEAVEAAKAKFKEVRKIYIEAKKELSDAQIDSLLLVDKAEKPEAIKRIWNARRAVKKAKVVYKAALKKLHEAEIARDAKIDRSPWK